ncbi:MAG: SDR family oxidoreductase [Acidobacteria bacterium]|nr:SDR family oxidoreductase [Acidobacteriota bacterium]
MSRHPALDGLKALITGSSSGIGRATAELLLQRGAAVVGIARDHTKFAPHSKRYEPVTLDLSDLDVAATTLDDLARVHQDVAAAISNAGAGRFGAIEQFSASQIRHDIDLNLTSHLLLARSFLPVLKRRNGGDLIIIGSEAALRGARTGSVYCAAKFGLRGAAQAFADECSRRGVRVTLVNPGFVRTPFFDALDFEPADDPGSALTPEDIAAKLLEILETPDRPAYHEINIDPPDPALRYKR